MPDYFCHSGRAQREPESSIADPEAQLDSRFRGNDAGEPNFFCHSGRAQRKWESSIVDSE